MFSLERGLAKGLAAQGIGQGDVVAVMDWDTHRYFEAFFAVPMLGAVLHTINVRLAPAQIAYTIDHAEDDVIVVDDSLVPLLAKVAGDLKKRPCDLNYCPCELKTLGLSCYRKSGVRSTLPNVDV